MLPTSVQGNDMRTRTAPLIVACVLLRVLLMAAPATAQNKPRTDGYFWLNSLRIPDRNMYALGMLDGTTYLYSTLHIGDGLWSAEMEKAQQKIIQKYLTISAESLREGLDAFYSDYRNRRILISMAAWPVLMEIAGTPRQQLESTVEKMRAAAVER